MRYGFLSHYFTGIVTKRLSSVEADPARSHQHEFNGTAELRNLLGHERFEQVPALFIWLGGENEGLTDDARVTWYDSRERHPTRSEWRLYFTKNAVMDAASEGDLLILARRPDDTLLAIVAPRDSTMERRLIHLFDLERKVGLRFHYEEFSGQEDRELDFAGRYILEELGMEIEEPEAVRLDEIIEKIIRKNGHGFPASREFSNLARQNADAPDPRDDPDCALIAWLEFEEALFRRLERHIVGERLRIGFLSKGEPDIDGFLRFSLSVQNRRKSRMGLALENHVEETIRSWGLLYDRGARTEGHSKPDFLFPGHRFYRDPTFDPERLTMLGVKSTLKDRWRQVLAEAERITRKHLLTLEPILSSHQTEEMKRNGLQLVVPASLHHAYTPSQQRWIMSFRSFLELVRSRQPR